MIDQNLVQDFSDRFFRFVFRPRHGVGLSAIVLAWVLSSVASADVRSFDGVSNNVAHPEWGAAGTAFLRMDPISHYADGISQPAGVATRPNPRIVSNGIGNQAGSMPDADRRSDFVWQFGQFLDHDITLSPTGVNEFFPIMIEDMSDPLYPMIPMMRSAFDATTGTGTSNPRQQLNNNSSFIDASMVYGSDEARANALREYSGGRLNTTAGGGLMMRNTLLLPNANEGPEPNETLFLTGDVRANEQIGLTSIQTLFVREHNRLADDLAADHPNWNDQQIYEHARRLVGAMVQNITYREYLPALLGPAAPSLNGVQYDDRVNPAIANEFATAAYRLGHTQVSEQLRLLDATGQPVGAGVVPLEEAFFRPSFFTGPQDVDYVLRGQASQVQQSTDVRMIDTLRNAMFGGPGNGGLDLLSLNIQRGRDHGLPTFIEMQAALGMTMATSFADITSDADVLAVLDSVYDDVGDVDLWIGLLAEDDLPGAAVGSTMAAIVSDQFYRLMVGDRFFMLWDDELSQSDEDLIANSSLSQIILRNTSITSLQSNVFFVPEPTALALFLALFVSGWLVGVKRRSGSQQA